MKRRFETLVSVALLGLCWTFTGCERNKQGRHERTSASIPRDASALPAGLFIYDVPPGARSVAEVKAEVKNPGEVVVHGRIGGRREPFVDGAAVFLLADTGMKTCAELHGDTCPTPWDYCCEPRESLTAKTATIQVIGDDGKPLGVDLKGRQGLEPMAEVTVVGEIQTRVDASALLINARRVYVHPRGG